MKKLIGYILRIFIVFNICLLNANAYEYIDLNNRRAVIDTINEIYDAKQQYEDLAGGYDQIEVVKTSSNAFWWPIGSDEETKDSNGKIFAKGAPVSTTITSYFGSTEKGIHDKGHGAIDIGSAGRGAGSVNVIASKSGTVIYPTDKSQTSYPDSGYLGNPDGGGYGNYIKIQHSDGTITLYAHLSYNTITVMAGDVVEQGQVIAKLGHSGNSTGPHLHFEMRIGGDSGANRVDPLDYVDPDNPRPISYGSGNSFSIVETTLTKEEFVHKMQDYCTRSGNKGFCNNFASIAGDIYTASLDNGVNPELVVVTAGAESSWTLSSGCQFTNNYWGLGIANGNSCLEGGKYSSVIDGIAAYAKSMENYTPTGSNSSLVTTRYNEREAAGCDPAGHGLPGTLEGMQSVYSWVGYYRYNPGSAGQGGCHSLNVVYGAGYCDTVPNCKDYKLNKAEDDVICPAESATTVCEQNDYTAWQLRSKAKIRYDIFGL